MAPTAVSSVYGAGDADEHRYCDKQGEKYRQSGVIVQGIIEGAVQVQC
jgi:hypothetical protein